MAVVSTVEEQHKAIDRAYLRPARLLPNRRSAGHGGEALADAFELLLAVVIAEKPKKELALTIGMAMYEGDPAVVKAVLAHTPLPIRLLVPVIGRRRYASYVSMGRPGRRAWAP
ncbi:hypothetical protein [Streptomyces sp. NPDC001307]|uniref:hypothetical protein n=1 Tax=Streptomyces sp. NPDC001307 TaxID=3364560 RepID=UPI0036BE4B83